MRRVDHPSMRSAFAATSQPWSPARWSACRTSRPSSPTGPFNDLSHAEQLADAFTAVRRRCTAQLVLLGTAAAHRHRAAHIRTGCRDRRAPGQGIRPRAGGQTWSPPQMSWYRAPHRGRRGCWSVGRRPARGRARLTRQPCGWSYPPARDWSTGQGTCPGWQRRYCGS